MKQLLCKIFFIVGILCVILFFIWTKLFFISLLLLLLIDSMTIQVVLRQVKKKLSNRGYLVLKYVGYISLPILLAIFLRTFFLDVYYVPSSSMERTLFPGDYVLIDKFNYGVKLPNHLRNVPVIGNLFTAPKNEFNLFSSLKNFKELKREDVVVFKAVDGTDKFLIKRIIGLPGDTIGIKESKVYINATILKENENYTYNYVKQESGEVSTFNNLSNKEFFELSDSMKKKYKRNIKRKTSYNFFIYPSEKQQEWTQDNYGEIIVPKKGLTITLTPEHILLYAKLIRKFENVAIKQLNSPTYTFKKNYYFMLGDNRHNSIDSRSFGFAPESYIQGKMIQIF